MSYINKQATLADIKDFKDWLVKSIKAGATTYDAQSPTNCLVCQYLKARGKTKVMFESPTKVYVHNGGKHEVALPVSIAKIAYGLQGRLIPRGDFDFDADDYTFKGALDRTNMVIEQLS